MTFEHGLAILGILVTIAMVTEALRNTIRNRIRDRILELLQQMPARTSWKRPELDTLLRDLEQEREIRDSKRKNFAIIIAQVSFALGAHVLDKIGTTAAPELLRFMRDSLLYSSLALCVATAYLLYEVLGHDEQTIFSRRIQ